MSDLRELTEQEIRDGDDALTAEIEAWADDAVRHETEVAQRMKHIVAAIRVAAVPLDCVTGEALRNVGTALSAIIHEAIGEEPA